MNQKDAKQDLLFDLSDYRAHKEVEMLHSSVLTLNLSMNPRICKLCEIYLINVAYYAESTFLIVLE